MRLPMLLLLISSTALVAQQAPDQLPNGTPVLKSRTQGAKTTEVRPEEATTAERAIWVVPAGTKLPVQLKQAVSTKNAQPGDALYGQTTFPIVVEGNVMVPAGTYVQGVIDSVKRAGRIKGTAEMAFHITTLVYPNGYTLNMAAAVNQVPGDETSRIKEPGTLKRDPEKGKDLEKVLTGAAVAGGVGSMAGAAAGGTVRSVGVGGLAGMGAGTLIALLGRGSDLRLERGAVVEVVLTQPIGVERDKVARAAAIPAYFPAQQLHD